MVPAPNADTVPARSMQQSLLEPNDLERLVCHLRRHGRENGVGDDLFNPYPRGYEVDPDALRLRRRAAWPLSVSQPGWARTWALWHRDRVVGHVELFGSRLPAEGHRARLGMGLEREFRGRGNGRRLLETCLSWAREQPSLAWIDLGVFSRNAAARALYESCGFAVVGSVRDRFRVDGESIDDLAMTLGLRRDG